jgi:predicted ArsR family transcriptional regulator
MERQTRQLLRILADDLTDDLLARLSEKALTETEIQGKVSGSRQTISRRLLELESLGIAMSEDHRSSGRGRPTRIWRLASPEIVDFRRAADEFLLRLLEGQARRHRDAIRYDQG